MTFLRGINQNGHQKFGSRFKKLEGNNLFSYHMLAVVIYDPVNRPLYKVTRG